MTIRVVLIGAALAAIAGIPASAQEAGTARQTPDVGRYIDPVVGITLEQAVAMALEREPGLRASRADVDVARGMRVQAGLRPNPNLSFMQQNEPAGTDSQTRIEVQWPLDLFRKGARVAVAERDIEAARHDVSDLERLLAADVRLQYGEVAAAVRELQVVSDLAAATARQQSLLAARVEQGADRPLDRDMLQVELRRIESERELHAGRVERAVYELKRLLGLSADSPLAIREPLEALVEREAAPLPGPAGAAPARADVLAAAARIESADAGIDLAKRQGRFDATLFGAYMRMDAGFMQRGFTPAGDLARVRGVFHYAAGGVMVMLPIRNHNQGTIAAAEARHAAALAEAEAVRLAAEAEIAAARARDERARRAVDVYRTEAIALAARNLDVVRQTYALGRATVFDVLAEQRRYLDTERAYTSALKEAYDARQALRRALGVVR